MSTNYPKSIQLGLHKVGQDHPPFIIAEISANHNHDFDRVIKMLEGAKQAGVQCIKLQTWTQDGMTLDLKEGPFLIQDPDSLWYGYSLYELYNQARLPWEWHKPIFDKCKELGLTAISTPFDHTSVDFLESLDVPFYKIASFENNDLPLIAKVAATQKPVIISSGLASAKQLIEAVECARDHGANDIIVLKCTSQYPADPRNVNLVTIQHMKELLQCEVGLSDHTQGIGTAVASVALGACVIEKHFNLSEQDESLDSTFSLGVQRMKMMVQECLTAWQAKGSVQYGMTQGETSSAQFRRSICVTKDLKKGDVLTHDNIRVIRPGFGLAPKYLKYILGRQITKAVKKGGALNWEIIGESKQENTVKLEKFHLSI